MNCEPCANEGREVEATAEYHMATVPPPRGVIPICAEHAEIMTKWAGRVSRREFANSIEMIWRVREPAEGA